MRVLHVNKFLYRRGGAEGYLLDVARLQRQAGDEVAYFGMDHPDNEPGLRYRTHFPAHLELDPAPPGVRGRAAVAGRMIWSTSARSGLARVLADFRPNVVHLHNIYHQLSPSVVAAARTAGVPCVLTLHDYKLACPSYQMLDHGRLCDACVTGGPWQAARRSCKDGSRSASTLLAVESWLHRRLGAYGGIGVFLAPSRFLAGVFERAGVYPDRLRVLRHPAEPLAAKTAAGGGVVFAGRLAREKGVDVLIEAASRLPAGVTVDIAGDGPDRSALRERAERVAPGRVRFHGRLGREQLHELIRSSAVAAVPSRWYENQPLAVLEAFACGVPVVGTGLGGLPELITPGVDGETVPADDPVALAAALARIVTDPARALAMGRAGRDKVGRDFRPGDHLAGLRDAYAASRETAGAGAMSEPIRVLFLAGSGRSGSTLVTTILGQLDGFFAAGELRYLWQRGVADNRPCGCGLPLRECPTWSAILARIGPADAAGIAARLRSRLRMRLLPGVLRRRTVAPHPDDATIAALYRALAGHTGGAVIVDSSKLPPYGALLGGLPGIEVRVLHVVRDPRAAAFSWRRRRALDAGPDDRQMTRHPVWKAALLWAVWNAATLRLWGRRATYLRIRYEDLMAAPAATIRRIADFAGAPPGLPLPFTANGDALLDITHSVAGNPARHRVGAVPVTADDEWRRALPRRSHAVVTALTGPLLLGLGYRLGRWTR